MPSTRPRATSEASPRSRRPAHRRATVSSSSSVRVYEPALTFSEALKSTGASQAGRGQGVRESRRNGRIYGRSAPHLFSARKQTLRTSSSNRSCQPPLSPRRSQPLPRLQRSLSNKAWRSTMTTTPAASSFDPQSFIRESRCLQMIVPGVYVSITPQRPFSGAHPEMESMLTPSNRAFSHIVELSTHGAEGDVASSVDLGSWAKRLRLYVPKSNGPSTNPSDESGDARAFRNIFTTMEPSPEDLALMDFMRAMQPRFGSLCLTEHQFVLAREFLQATGIVRKLSRATPSSKSSNARRRDKHRFERRANLLITVPLDRRADAIALVVLYIAAELGCSARDVLTVHDRPQKSCCREWQNVVSEDGKDFLEFMAEIS
ncbi:hypothetical protein HGRIS_001756 [Hohenbuehelia grisea]|uniref:Uncharacterized protein n=1 Tax=Hohenbuehelia grisea TaxID=104357 RepID=A0ABR3JIE0_9AGAR